MRPYFLTILVIIALLGLSRTTKPRYCSCQQLKQENECLIMVFDCIWDAASSTCSQKDCDSEERKVCQIGLIRDDCVINFNQKCSVVKATCAEYTSETAIIGCPLAIEGYCEVNSAAESKKCKKIIPVACISSLTKYDCNNMFIHNTACYFDDSKTGSDQDPQCLESIADCSGTVEVACPKLGCIWDWRNKKCQVKTCSHQGRAECQNFITNTETYQVCKREERACVDQDMSLLTADECFLQTQFTHHFDGSCKPCFDVPLNATNSTNATDSIGLTLIAAMILWAPILVN